MSRPKRYFNMNNIFLGGWEGHFMQTLYILEGGVESNIASEQTEGQKDGHTELLEHFILSRHLY